MQRKGLMFLLPSQDLMSHQVALSALFYRIEGRKPTQSGQIIFRMKSFNVELTGDCTALSHIGSTEGNELSAGLGFIEEEALPSDFVM